MKITNPIRFTVLSAWLTGSMFFGEVSGEAAQTGGLPVVTDRVTALEALVLKQSNQIAALTDALDAERAARRASDEALQAQINNLQPTPFSATQIATLQGLAGVMSVDQTNIYVAASICVGGDVGIQQGHTLFVSHIQPSTGNSEGITVFDGNVGIQATKTLFVNNLRAFQAIPPSTQELLEFGLSMPPFTINGAGPAATVIMYGPVLFRSDQ